MKKRYFHLRMAKPCVKAESTMQSPPAPKETDWGVLKTTAIQDGSPSQSMTSNCPFHLGSPTPFLEVEVGAYVLA